MSWNSETSIFRTASLSFNGTNRTLNIKNAKTTLDTAAIGDGSGFAHVMGSTTLKKINHDSVNRITYNYEP